MLQVTDKSQQIYQNRQTYSELKLGQLSKRIAGLPGLNAFADLTMFAAGSFARNDASNNSDIDMFFINGDMRSKVEDPRTNELRMFGELVKAIDELSFPKFSNDCQYLKIIDSCEIINNIGNEHDDYQNYFTVRMLLLLESKCLYGNANFEKIVKQIIASYFEDYPRHKETFEPIFLLNDVSRFWKTLTLNYENKRKQRVSDEERIKQKVKNFKLKFSRMTTCFATMAALGSHSETLSEDQVFELVLLTPRDRLKGIVSRIPETKGVLENLLSGYSWFLEQTALTQEELENQMADNTRKIEMFNKADEYGENMFKLLLAIDEKYTDKRRGFMRYLVI